MENEELINIIKGKASSKAYNITSWAFGILIIVIIATKIFVGLIFIVIIAFLLYKVIYNYYFNDMINKHNRGENI